MSSVPGSAMRRRSDDTPCRIAIIGAGVMGTNHARVLKTVPNAIITAVVDGDAERATALATVARAHVHSLDTVAEVADAAIIATPSHTHAAIGTMLMRAGLDVLIEKPIATTVADAQLLVESARETGRVLMIGHVERFNAAVLGLSRLIDRPVHLEFTRAGTFSPRITSDVVLDLMIHDLDLLRMLAGPDTITKIEATGNRVHSDSLDIASCLLTTASGVTATLTASRAGQNKIRLIEVTQRENFVTADLLRQDVNVFRVAHSEFVTENGTSYSQSGIVEIPFLERAGEPLRLEIDAFLDAVSGKHEPPVTGEDGLAALRLALHVSEKAGAGNAAAEHVGSEQVESPTADALTTAGVH